MLAVTSEQLAVVGFSELDGNFDEWVGAGALVCNKNRVWHWHEHRPIDLQSFLNQATEDNDAQLTMIVQLVVGLDCVIKKPD